MVVTLPLTSIESSPDLAKILQIFKLSVSSRPFGLKSLELIFMVRCNFGATFLISAIISVKILALFSVEPP